MVKKKSVKKIIKKKKIKKNVKRIAGKSKKLVRSTKRKINLVLRNLVLFAVLSLIFFALYSVTTNEVFENLFFLLVIIFGFLSLAFLIVLLIFLVLKAMKK